MLSQIIWFFVIQLLFLLVSDSYFYSSSNREAQIRSYTDEHKTGNFLIHLNWRAILSFELLNWKKGLIPMPLLYKWKWTPCYHFQ